MIPERFEDTLGRQFTTDEEAYFEQMRPYVECGFIVTGTRDTARNIGVQEFGWDPTKAELETLSNLRLTISPNIEGQEHLSPLSTNVLVYYTPASPRRAREKLHLGPYANLLPYHDGTVFLWEDALLAHTAELADRI